MVRAGIPRSVAMKISGHLTEAVYRRYAIVSTKNLRDAGARLEQYMGTLSVPAERTEKERVN